MNFGSKRLASKHEIRVLRLENNLPVLTMGSNQDFCQIKMMRA